MKKVTKTLASFNGSQISTLLIESIGFYLGVPRSFSYINAGKRFLEKQLEAGEIMHLDIGFAYSLLKAVAS